MKNKKVIYIVIISIILALITFAVIYIVNSKEVIDGGFEENLTKNSFIGYITQINSGIATVKVSDGYILASGDLVNVDLLGNHFEKGTKIKVIYDGNIMETYPLKIKVVSIEKVEYSNVVKLYTTLIDDLMAEDQALNYNMQYIAIDINSFMPFNNTNVEEDKDMYPKMLEEDKQDIVNYLYRYHDNIKVASYKDLQEQGLVIDNELTIPHIDGILINIGKIEKKSDNHYLISMCKYKSALGAIFPEYEAKYINDNWNFEIKSMAIS